MALARVTYTQSVSGNRNFSVPFPYISRDHVKVTVNGTASTFSWLSASSIQLTTAPAVGVKVEVRRVTERNSTLVDFADGSTLTESQLDLANKQNFYLAQEADDLAVESNGLAKVATDTANAATTTANEAKTLATTAVSAANTASSTANTADSKATSAVSTANTANTKADQALAKAANAETVAGAANSKADSAVSTANTASGTANGASTLANAAKTQAERAEAASNTATNTANTALATANTALQNSANASYLANQSEQSARDAKGAAESAAQDAATAVQTASGLQVTVNKVLQDVQQIAGGDLSDFSKNSRNLADLSDKAAARSNLGLGQVDNTRDLDKPVSTATQQALAGKADSGHTHAISQVNGLQTALDGKAAAAHSHPISDVTGLQSALDGKAASGHGHAISDVSGLQSALNAASGLTQGATGQDPNGAVTQLILTNHANTPNAGYYWHIYTSFYSSIAASSNRAQIAIQYNGGAQAYCRSCYSGTWTPWIRMDNGSLGTASTKNLTVSTAAPSGGIDGDVWIQY
ncbi:phage tail fiber protein [Pseudomonas sp. Sample_16]|uniref:phage tail fiber domain-containing protein n=1 Tax=Pseudomonas sp. Sample_16 TaxID=2448263 RepID=UPI001032944C|nr:phage tail fiber protein [Pseudomonas sp. Sample_16]